MVRQLRLPHFLYYNSFTERDFIMKSIGRLAIFAVCICIIFAGCGKIEYPELSDTDKETCMQALGSFLGAANRLEGEALHGYCDNDLLMYKHSEALNYNEGKLTEAQESAYWTVVIINDMLPEGYELTDAQIQQMKMTIDKSSMKGYMDTAVFINGTMYFEEDKSDSKNIEICMYMGQNVISNTTFEPKISYIKFIE